MENTINIEDFGPLLPYIEDKGVVDISFNGTDTWIHTRHGLKYRADELKDKMTKQFITRFADHMQASASKEFNQQHPLLSITEEFNSQSLRISIIHESVCNGNHSICIRKYGY